MSDELSPIFQKLSRELSETKIALAAKEKELGRLREEIRDVINHPFTDKDEPFGKAFGNVLGRLKKLVEGKDDKKVIMDRSVDRFVKAFKDE